MNAVGPSGRRFRITLDASARSALYVVNLVSPPGQAPGRARYGKIGFEPARIVSSGRHVDRAMSSASCPPICQTIPVRAWSLRGGDGQPGSHAVPDAVAVQDHGQVAAGHHHVQGTRAASCSTRQARCVSRSPALPFACTAKSNCCAAGCPWAQAGFWIQQLARGSPDSHRFGEASNSSAAVGVDLEAAILDRCWSDEDLSGGCCGSRTCSSEPEQPVPRHAFSGVGARVCRALDLGLDAEAERCAPSSPSSRSKSRQGPEAAVLTHGSSCLRDQVGGTLAREASAPTHGHVADGIRAAFDGATVAKRTSGHRG